MIIKANRKICVIYTHFPHYRQPVFNALSRSSSFSYSFYYDKRGIESTIASGVASGANHHQLTTRRFKSLFWQSGAVSLALRSDCGGFIFLGNPLILSTWLAAIIARVRGIGVFFWTHGWVRDEVGVKDWLRCRFYHLANGLLLYGNRAKRLGMRRGFAREVLHVIGNSLDYDKQVCARDDFQSHAAYLNHMGIEKPFFLVVSRLIEGAAIDLAVEALGRISEDVALVVIGDGPCRREIESLGCLRGVDLRFMGAIYSEEELAGWFMNCVAVVSPGKVGLLAMHALAYGAAVITHGDEDRQMPEFEAIQDGVTGSFFGFGDVEGLADRMRHSLEEHFDEARKKIRREAAVAAIERFYTPQRQVELIEAALVCSGLYGSK